MRKQVLLQMVPLLWGLWLLPAMSAGAGDQTVVFICDHGNVKSLIAASLFNRGAARRHLSFHAVARGVTPAAGPVPEPVAAGLHDDGFDVAGFEARPIAAAELQTASRVVLLNVDPAAVPAADIRKTAVWTGIPPAGTGYAQARDDIARRVDLLLQQLAEHAHNG